MDGLDAPAGSGTRALAGRTILAVLAHPDDESLACGGTLARAADSGARVALVCASRGERGSVSDPALVADADLGTVRARELRDAAAVLGLSEVTLLDHPDGDLRWARVPMLHDEILLAIERTQPDAVITFGEDGLYWHLDHIGVHERTYTAVKSLGRSAPPLYFVTMPPHAMRRVVEAAHRKGGAPPDSTFWGIAPDSFGDHAAPPSFAVDVRPWAARKLRALHCHRTQMGPRNPLSWIDEADMRECLGRELFRRSPLDSNGARVLETLAAPEDVA
ncbi:MAG: PIG-L deacetylase family protein [Betaproteobacteria bacterium]